MTIYIGVSWEKNSFGEVFTTLTPAYTGDSLGGKGWYWLRVVSATRVLPGTPQRIKQGCIKTKGMSLDGAGMVFL